MTLGMRPSSFEPPAGTAEKKGSRAEKNQTKKPEVGKISPLGHKIQLTRMQGKSLSKSALLVRKTYWHELVQKRLTG